MKYLFILLLICSTASASLLEPIFECRNDNHSFSLVVSSSTDATVHYKRNICPIKIVELSHRKGRVGADGLNLNFVVNDCHKKIFYNKGFLKIDKNSSVAGYTVYVLALKGQQTFECKSTKSQVEKLMKLEEL